MNKLSLWTMPNSNVYLFKRLPLSGRIVNSEFIYTAFGMYSVFELVTKINVCSVYNGLTRYSEELTEMISSVLLIYYFLNIILSFSRMTLKLPPTVVKIQASGEGKAAEVRTLFTFCGAHIKTIFKYLLISR